VADARVPDAGAGRARARRGLSHPPHQWGRGLFSTGGGISFGGFLLALVLFILARVFRKGTEMREELEGTV
jgi:hypothetical protein